MSSRARTFLMVVSGLMLLGGAAGIVGGLPVFPLGLFGALILAGTLFDLGYRGAAGRQSGHAITWQRTGEREIDSLTGQPQEVWFDPLTGARRYEPLGSDPNRG